MLKAISKEWKHLSDREKEQWKRFYEKAPEDRSSKDPPPWEKYRDGYLPKKKKVDGVW